MVDENGVDLTRGTFTGTRTDLAIGPVGRSGLALIQRFGYQTNVSNFDLGLFRNGLSVTASTGLSSIPFLLSGAGSDGTYTAIDGSGAQLLKSGNVYTMTMRDGTVIVYDYLTHDKNDAQRVARASSTTYPTGEKVTLTWATVSWCSNNLPSCIPAVLDTKVRLQAVTSSLGYQLHYNYQSDSVTGVLDAPNWSVLQGVVAINTTVESCSPSAGHYALTGNWPTVGYSNFGQTVTDAEGRVQNYTVGSLSFSIRDATYTYAVQATGIVVSSVTRAGLTWNYNYTRALNGPTATMVVTEPGSRTRTIVSDLTVGLPTSITDELGRIYQTADGVTTTRFAYDGADMIAEYNGSNALQRRHVFDPASRAPLVWYEGTGTTDRRFLHADERGSVIATSNGSGTMLAIHSYDEFGIPGASTDGLRFGYTGQAWLPELGMAYHRARIYSPTLGRFMQTDPIGYGDGMNIYAYVHNDPVNSVDPSGLTSPDCPQDGGITVCGHRDPCSHGATCYYPGDFDLLNFFQPDGGGTGGGGGEETIVVTGRRESRPCQILRHNYETTQGILPGYVTGNRNWDNPNTLSGYKNYYQDNADQWSVAASRPVQYTIIALTAAAAATPIGRAASAGVRIGGIAFSIGAADVGSNELNNFIESQLQLNIDRVNALNDRLEYLESGCDH